MTTWAAFVIAPVADRPGCFAGTTRPGESGRVGLPGGKLLPGESPVEAAVREAAEEGWDIAGPLRRIYRAVVDGGVVEWFAAASATRRTEWLERGRVAPVALTADQVRASGMGNPEALRAFLGERLTRTERVVLGWPSPARAGDVAAEWVRLVVDGVAALQDAHEPVPGHCDGCRPWAVVAESYAFLIGRLCGKTGASTC